MTSFKRISVDIADQILAAETSAILIDTRNQASFSESHHPRALHLTDDLLRKLVKSEQKHSPVIIYCYHGNSSQDIARMFFDFGFKHCYSVDGGYAAWRCHIANDFKPTTALVNWMHDKGHNPESIDARLDDQYRTSLMLAARAGNEPMVRALVNAGANPNLVDKNGNNSLWYACMSQNIHCVRTLINADVEVDNHNNLGFSPLNYSIGMDDIFDLLSNYFNDFSLIRLNKPNTKSLLPQTVTAIAQ